MKLSGWGNYPRLQTALMRASNPADATRAIARSSSLIGRGNGRSYGDAAINPAMTLSMLPLDRMIAFDAENGILTCESGVLLADIIEHFVPLGWFVPVTPGTKFVTVGGMAASDVHGKNHHGAGTFGDHITAIELALADGRTLRCGPDENADLFAATKGGMGLTGVILAVSFRLMPIESIFIRRETLRAANLAEVMAMFEESQQWTYSVAWIDCLARGASLGRSLLYRGEHAKRGELPPGLSPQLHPVRRKKLRLPFDFPGFALNRWTVRAFNELYYRNGRPGFDFIDYDRYFYPLDALLDWNRLYGRSGFVQYQCVLPKSVGLAGMTALLEHIAQAGIGSFLAVLKLFGHHGDGMLSFPMEGYTLALDFPAGRQTFALIAELDRLVSKKGGRIYLAKDACSNGEVLRAGYPRLPEFQAIRERYDPAGKFSSAQSERLGL
jgi:FAD/FMN-containing dehydrogenase